MSDYWKKRDEEARKSNDISMIRFGGMGAQGSETWTKGGTMRKDQLRKLKTLVAVLEGVDDNFDDLV